MLERIFIYESKRLNEKIYLNGPYTADPKLLLKIYIDWYQGEFSLDEDDTDDRSCEDFTYIESICAIDFYDEYKDLYLKKQYE